jgi:hypothetical protein
LIGNDRFDNGERKGVTRDRDVEGQRECVYVMCGAKIKEKEKEKEERKVHTWAAP